MGIFMSFLSNLKMVEHGIIIEMNHFDWIKIIRMVLKIRYFFHIFEPSSLIIFNSSENLPYRVFSESEVNLHDSDVFGTYWKNIDFGDRLLIFFLWVIGPLDCDLDNHFESKMLEYSRRKLYLRVYFFNSYLLWFPPLAIR